MWTSGADHSRGCCLGGGDWNFQKCSVNPLCAQLSHRTVSFGVGCCCCQWTKWTDTCGLEKNTCGYSMEQWQTDLKVIYDKLCGKVISSNIKSKVRCGEVNCRCDWMIQHSSHLKKYYFCGCVIHASQNPLKHNGLTNNNQGLFQNMLCWSLFNFKLSILRVCRVWIIVYPMWPILPPLSS